MEARVSAWRPAVPGIAEVFHARFITHAYPLHTHDTWTLLIVDDGVIRYDLDRHHHGALGPAVTLLPPNVAHDGRAATSHGFRKRVLYLDTSVLGEDLIGAAVDRPSLADGLLRTRIHQLHESLAEPATRSRPRAGSRSSPSGCAPTSAGRRPTSRSAASPTTCATSSTLACPRR